MHKVLRSIIILVGASLGASLVAAFLSIARFFNLQNMPVFMRLSVIIGMYAVFVLLGGLLAGIFAPGIIQLFSRLEARLRSTPMADIALGSLGLIVGLLIAFLLSQVVALIPFNWLSITLSLFIYLVFSYLGIKLATTRGRELNLFAVRRRGERAALSHAHESEGAPAKVLDTSVIIDGRIFDICKTGFLEGRLIVPSFVLDELRAVSDSEDDLKRMRGRRGLDILARLQNELQRPVEVLERDFDEHIDVDNKLVRLANELGGALVTNDFNLNKVAKVQNVPVLNINDLSNAVKPVVLPGELMRVRVIKPGKEPGQGVAYLDDGTMIVIENGARYLDQTIEINVTSALQTSAGRMIFGRPAHG